ncbi:MAG: DNA helicase PcrA [Bacillota bacterium]|nr:DNA helicase PcrA [Bacillota bacterium]MDW7682852.1 DNA helicase PcrA [Bacillota bacterium]
MTEIMNELNEVQQRAVECTEGPLLILAGAGSGKTRVITHRIAYLIREKHAAPWEILALTFTNKAAEEMRSRLADLVGTVPGMWAFTFHAAAARILREHAARLGYTSSFVIYDDADQLTVVRNVLKGMNLEDSRFKPRGVLQTISRAKNEMSDAHSYAEEADNYYTRTVARIFQEYQERLQRNNALDFDDMLLLLVKLFREHKDVLEHYREKFRYILVDEYQDTNRVQYEIVRQLAGGHRNLCVVGDDDQSIYQFRGADLRNILDFERDWPEATVVKLEENYRSTGNILEAAYHVVRNNAGRKEKKLWTRHEAGDPVTVFAAEDEHQEGRYIAGEIRSLTGKYDQFAILYRTNAQSRAIEDALVRENIPYQMVGGVRFWERKEVKDILAYLRVLDNPADGVSLMRVINVPRRGIGATTLERLSNLANERHITFYESLKLCDEAGLGSAPLKKVREFSLLLENLLQMGEYLGVDELAEQVMIRSGYLDELRTEGTEQAQSREENLREFITVAQEFMKTSEDKSLTAFLTQLALISDLDTLESDEGPRVVMMTMHAAKGLEFPVVFIAGLEEGLFPHMRSFDTADGIEEERRLCYVGITRARRKLYLTNAKKRNIFGMAMQNLPSRFLAEIPSSVLEQNTEAQAPAVPAAPGEAGDLAVGDQVEHGKWGIGEVRAKDTLSDGDTVLTIFFQSLGLKKVIARYAPLRKVK